jgi:hypothetical protein
LSTERLNNLGIHTNFLCPLELTSTKDATLELTSTANNILCPIKLSNSIGYAPPALAYKIKNTIIHTY